MKVVSRYFFVSSSLPPSSISASIVFFPACDRPARGSKVHPTAESEFHAPRRNRSGRRPRRERAICGLRTISSATRHDVYRTPFTRGLAATAPSHFTLSTKRWEKIDCSASCVCGRPGGDGMSAQPPGNRAVSLAPECQMLGSRARGAHVQPGDDERPGHRPVRQAEGHREDVVAEGLEAVHVRGRPREARYAVDEGWGRRARRGTEARERGGERRCVSAGGGAGAVRRAHARSRGLCGETSRRASRC